MFGREAELLRESTLWGKNFHKEPSAELFESYVTTTIPVGEGLQFKGGLFVTLLGAEIISQPGSYNYNITNSFRSEERRVGKEWRSRWLPTGHDKEKEQC